MTTKRGFARLVPHLGRLARTTRWRRTRGRPRVWGHRGDSAHAPENTLAAFERARAVGADGIEFDVRFDGEHNVIVFHDRELARLTGRPGMIDAISAAERAELRIGGEPIPLLADVLATCELELNIELKVEQPGRGGELARAVAEVVKRARHGVLERTLISSFDPLALVQCHRHLPDVALGYIFHRGQRLMRRGWAGSAVGASLVHPDSALCDQASIKRWRAAGMAINVWTVDDDDELRRLAALGVDGVIANDPGHALRVLEAL